MNTGRKGDTGGLTHFGEGKEAQIVLGEAFLRMNTGRKGDTGGLTHFWGRERKGREGRGRKRTLKDEYWKEGGYSNLTHFGHPQKTSTTKTHRPCISAV